MQALLWLGLHHLQSGFENEFAGFGASDTRTRCHLLKMMGKRQLFHNGVQPMVPVRNDAQAIPIDAQLSQYRNGVIEQAPRFSFSEQIVKLMKKGVKIIEISQVAEDILNKRIPPFS